MAAAARSKSFGNPIEDALAALEQFDNLTRDSNKAAKNTDNIRLRSDRINTLLLSPEIDRVTRSGIRGSLTKFIGAVCAYLEFEENAAPPTGLSSTALRQLATNRNIVWADMRNATEQLFTALSKR